MGMRFEEIDKGVVISFVKKYHYSNVMPRLTKHWLGCYVESELVGVVTLGWGTQPLGTIKKLFPDENLTTEDYTEIGKMCFLKKYNNGNFGSIFVKGLKKWIKKNTNYKFLYTLADGIMGKVGYVYQASSFNYLGSFKTSVYYDNKTREKIHPRTARALCDENAKEAGKKIFWLQHNFCQKKNINKIDGLMFRYILPLNREAKEILKKHPKKDYPKDKDLKWWVRVGNKKYEETTMPNFDMELNSYSKQSHIQKKQMNIFDYEVKL